MNEAGGKELESFTERETPLAVGKHKTDQRVTRAPEKGYDAGRCWEAAGKSLLLGRKGGEGRCPCTRSWSFSVERKKQEH